MSVMAPPAHSRNREISAVVVLALGFGLVGIDRFLISAMYPAIAADLDLSYSDIGLITGALAVAWGLAALIMGNLADRIGRRRVLVASLIVFSMLIGASGLAASLTALIVVRVAMGFADGAFTPASISATIEASPSQRHGRNIGVQQMTLTLFGLGLGPLLVGELLHYIDWRLVFVLFAAPGLLVAYLTFRFIPAGERPAPSKQNGSLDDWRKVLSYRNIRVLMLLMLCWLTCLITTSALMPNYLIDHLRLDFPAMGRVMSAIGFGSAAGTLLLPWLSDRLGRRPVMLTATLGGAGMLVVLGQLGRDVGPLFLALFLVHFFNNALITLTVGPVCAESVPPALMATASGMVIAVGELFGGGLAPMLAGFLADRFGIEHLLWMPLFAMAAGFALCLFLTETRPAHRRATSEGARV